MKRSIAFLLLPLAASPALALSEDDAKQYQSGAGMGYAKAAELNHYPGPMHVLELADSLKLTDAQLRSVRELMTTHKEEAREIGKRLVAAEQEIDALFRSGSVDAATLRAKVEAAGALQAQYRLSHLETHRRTRALLTAEQVQRYDALRGYTKEHSHGHGHGH